MARAIVLMMDSLGIGASADADEFGDQGADTFGLLKVRVAKSSSSSKSAILTPTAKASVPHLVLGEFRDLKTLPPYH